MDSYEIRVRAQAVYTLLAKEGSALEMEEWGQVRHGGPHLEFQHSGRWRRVAASSRLAWVT